MNLFWVIQWIRGSTLCTLSDSQRLLLLTWKNRFQLNFRHLTSSTVPHDWGHPLGKHQRKKKEKKVGVSYTVFHRVSFFLSSVQKDIFPQGFRCLHCCHYSAAPWLASPVGRTGSFQLICLVIVYSLFLNLSSDAHFQFCLYLDMYLLYLIIIIF